MSKNFVLLVEDNPDDVGLTQIAFKRCHISHELVIVENGQDALDFLFGEGKYAGRDVSQVPAVVLLDLKLPLVSGIEVLKRIRLDTRIGRLPVVVLSSSINLHEIDECEKVGINRYCRKPDNFDALQRIIEDIRDSYLEKNRNPTGHKRMGIIPKRTG